jgi:hypothetical protein
MALVPLCTFAIDGVVPINHIGATWVEGRKLVNSIVINRNQLFPLESANGNYFLTAIADLW